MARKGQFKKGGGRHGGGSKSRGGGALVVVQAPAARKARRSSSRAPATTHKAKRGGSRAHHGGGLTLGKAVLTGLVLGSAAETNNGPLGTTVFDLVQKIPGAKTFGGAATAGLAIGAIGEFTKLGSPKMRSWMKIAGLIGVGLAAVKVGTSGTAFKWLGDDDDYDGVADVET